MDIQQINETLQIVNAILYAIIGLFKFIMSYKTSAICPRKAQARRDTIIEPYRELIDKFLPHGKQYWTLAGPCYDDEGKLGTNSEIWQMTAAGLIFANQYHGIDNSEETITKNKKVAPAANFYYGDFVKELTKAKDDGRFNPGIIHADFTKMSKTSVSDTGNIVYLVEQANIYNVMIVSNFPYNNPYAGSLKGDVSSKEILKMFEQNQRFNNSWNDRWTIYPKFYYYGGTGKTSKTTMITFIFYRK